MPMRLVSVVSAALIVLLAACAGPGAAAKPTVAPAPGGASAAPAAAASAAKAPGPYTANGEIDGSSGKVTIQALDSMKFSPNTITNVSQGEKVTVEMKNAGAIVHDFYAPALGVNNALVVNGGQTGTVTFTAPNAAGTYDFWCNQPGHAQAGMVGHVVVK